MNTSITSLDTKLTKSINDAKTELGNRITNEVKTLNTTITNLDTKLTKNINDAKTELGDRITNEVKTLNTTITNLETSLTNKINSLISYGTSVPTTLATGKVFLQYF